MTLVKSIQLILFILFFNHCAVVKTDHLIRPVARRKALSENNLILNGVTSGYWKTPYSISNVFATVNKGIIVNVAYYNIRSRYWFVGFWVMPLMPTFGIEFEKETAKTPYGKDALLIAILPKDIKNGLALDICDLSALTKNKMIKIKKFRYRSGTIVSRFKTCNAKKTIHHNAPWLDIVIYEIYFEEKLKQNFSIRGLNISHKKSRVYFLDIDFKKDYGWVWTSHL